MNMHIGYWNPLTRKWFPEMGIGVMDEGTLLLSYSFTWGKFQSQRVMQ